MIGCCIALSPDFIKVNKPRILLMSGGNQVGQNILDALADRRSGLTLVATNTVATDISLFACDAVYLTPETRGAPAAFERRFSEILALEKPDLVIPCRDDDVAFLADYREQRPELAKDFLCGNRFTAEATCDKWLSWQFSVDRGLPFAPTLATPIGAQAETFASEYGFPLVAKPRRGFASRGVYLVFNEAQLCRVATQDGYVIQKYLSDPSILEAHLRSTDQLGIPLFHSFEGTKISLEILIAPNGSPAGNFSFAITLSNDRTMRFERHESEEATALGEQCTRVFADAGWRGPMNIQCKLTSDRRLVIFEYNGRFNGGTAARRLMGYDEVGLAIKAFTGKELEPARSPHGRSPRVVRRILHMGPRCEDSAKLTRDGHWQAETRTD
jgi:carbamoylphosphate synthase large subunit